MRKKLKNKKNIFMKLVRIFIGLIICTVAIIIIKNVTTRAVEPYISTDVLAITDVNMPVFNVNAQLTQLGKIIDSSWDNISTSEVSGTTVKIKPGDSVKVSYTVKTNPLGYGDPNSQCQYREVAVLLDNSIETNTWSSFKDPLNNILNKLLSGTGVTTRADFVILGDNSASLQYKGTDYAQITGSNLGSSILKQPLGQKDLKAGLDQAVQYLDSFNYPYNTTSKSIIIFARANVKPLNTNDSATQNLIKKIKGNYNVLTVQITDETDLGNLNLKNDHKILCGFDFDYYKCNPYNTGSENHINVQTVMDSINPKLNRMNYKIYGLVNVEADFNLGNDIIPENDVNLVGNELTLAEINTKKYKKILPEIIYTVDIDQVTQKPNLIDGKLKYIGYFTDSSPQSDTSYVIFAITSQNTMSGIYKFATPNQIVYSYSEYDPSYFASNNISETPTLQIGEASVVVHGIYQNMSGGIATIDTSNRAFATGAIVPFAANIQNLFNGTVSVIIDNGSKFEGVIKIYSIETSDLIKTVYPQAGANQCDISIDYQANHNIVIMYNAKLNGTSNPYYENDIQINGINCPARISPSNTLLPDLF